MLDAKVLETKKFHKKSIGFLMRDFGNCFTLAESNLNKEQCDFLKRGEPNVYQVGCDTVKEEANN